MNDVPDDEIPAQDDNEPHLELDDALTRGQARRNQLVEELWAEFH